MSFARALTEKGYQPAIFKFTQGGSSLESRWEKPGNGGLYDQMTKTLELAIRKLRADGHQVRIWALIWIQGEADAVFPGSAARYEENLDALVRHFRQRIAHQDSLPVILGVDEKNPYVVRRPIIVEAQKNLCARDKHMIRTSMLGLKKKDRTHLKPSALVKHGERLADAFFTLDSELHECFGESLRAIGDFGIAGHPVATLSDGDHAAALVKTPTVLEQIRDQKRPVHHRREAHLDLLQLGNGSQSAWKPAVLCAPSQNGLFCE